MILAAIDLQALGWWTQIEGHSMVLAHHRDNDRAGLLVFLDNINWS